MFDCRNNWENGGYSRASGDDVTGCLPRLETMIASTTVRLRTRHPTACIAALLLVSLLIGLHGCSRPAVHYSADTVLHGSLGGYPIEHVVIFAVDGL